ncbi:MAG: methyltransferase domain-containing protein [Euryarchaeota archaeon]|nr:methyltransferase domain-containing protein [Euryarchaeota archaeon]
MIPFTAGPAADWDLLRSVLGEHLHPGGAALSERVLSLASPPPNGALVDVGSGRGATLQRARARWPSLRAFGVEPGAPGAGGDGVTILRGRATEIPLPSSSVDAVISECALCLSGSWEHALTEVRRVLRPGGRLVFSDFYAEGPVPRVPAVVGALACLQDVRSGNQLLTLLEGAGFGSVRLHDESGALRELENRVQQRLDVRGLLAQLAHAAADPTWKDVHGFLEDAIQARDAGALRYGIFSATK